MEIYLLQISGSSCQNSFLTSCNFSRSRYFVVSAPGLELVCIVDERSINLNYKNDYLNIYSYKALNNEENTYKSLKYAYQFSWHLDISSITYEGPCVDGARAP